MSTDTFEGLARDILCGGSRFLEGVHRSSESPAAFVSAVVEWARATKRGGLGEILAVVEPCIRQSILMTLVPAKAVHPSYRGSIDNAIDEHLAVLGLDLPPRERGVLRNLCISVRKYHGLDSVQARNRTMSLGQLRALGGQYRKLLAEQKGRCIWCGVELGLQGVKQTLEHVAPKHIGNDQPDGSNWALACTSCNIGKSDALAWSTRPEAHDFLDRLAFERTEQIGLAQRWAVLMRERRCDKCRRTPAECELWPYKRIATGLAIPANCSATCISCMTTGSREPLAPAWHPEESLRGTPPIEG
jgi:hypothetical protein